MPNNTLLEVKDLKMYFENKKGFLGKKIEYVKAVDGVSFKIQKGETIGLVGESGCGKSTTGRAIVGLTKPDSGSILYDGKDLCKLNDKEFKPLRKELQMVFQNTLSALNPRQRIGNILEDILKIHSNLDAAERREKVVEVLKKVGLSEDHYFRFPHELSGGQVQRLGIASALVIGPKLIVCDEPVSALDVSIQAQVLNLFNRLQQQYNLTYIFISHDLEELMEVCSKLIVLRDGVFVAELEKSEFEEEKIKELMVGRKLTGDYYRSDYDGSYGKEVVLSAEKLYVGDSLKGVSLELHKGEILGIGGLTDCGMHELGKALFGNVKPLYGEVKLGNGKKITSEKQAIKNKIGYVSKNRDQEALILSASIMENTVLPSLSMIAKGGVITKGAEKKFTDKQVKDMSIKCREIGQNVGDLSGGNKQKVVFGKWLGNESEIYILDCPTRGIDIGVKAFMYQLMYRLKKEGKSILMISEELPELIGMSDRILIMKDGQIQDSFTRSEELNESVLIKKMV